MSMSMLSKSIQINFLLQNEANTVILDPKEEYPIVAGDAKLLIAVAGLVHQLNQRK